MVSAQAHAPDSARTAAVDGTPDMEVHSKERDVRN